MKHSIVTFRAAIVAAFVALTVMIAPSIARADYTISKSEAQANARDAASYLYGDRYGVHGVQAKCRAQFVREDPNYNYHRWVCGWAGYDVDGDVVGGRLRITGHSDGTYGYMELIKIRWV